MRGYLAERQRWRGKVRANEWEYVLKHGGSVCLQSEIQQAGDGQELCGFTGFWRTPAVSSNATIIGTLKANVALSSLKINFRIDAETDCKWDIFYWSLTNIVKLQEIQLLVCTSSDLAWRCVCLIWPLLKYPSPSQFILTSAASKT